MQKQTLFPALALVVLLGGCASRKGEDPRARMSPAERTNYTPSAAIPTAAAPTEVATVLPPTPAPPILHIDEPAEAAAEAAVAQAVNDFPSMGIWAEYLYVAGFAVSFGVLSAVAFFLLCLIFATVAFRRYAHLYVGVFNLNRRPPNE